MLIGFLVAVGLAMGAAAIASARCWAWVLAGAGAALLALAAGAGPFLEQAGDWFTAVAKVPIRAPAVIVLPGTTWKTDAPGNRSLAGWCGPLRLVVALPARLGLPGEPTVATGHSGGRHLRA